MKRQKRSSKQRPARWIYLSPHLDDAILSAGGLIYEQTRANIPVEIWTVFCGFPNHKELSQYARTLHTMWDTSSARKTVRIRRAEDKCAASIVGAKVVHFNFWDCIYRRLPNGEWLYDDVFAPIHEADADIPARIVHAISPHLAADDTLVCQLALGSHVDHLLARRAAEKLGRPLQYVTDVPYVFNHPEELAPKTEGMNDDAQKISEAGLAAWMDAISAYKSQIFSLFEDGEKMRAAMQDYWSQRGAISLWRYER